MCFFKIKKQLIGPRVVCVPVQPLERRQRAGGGGAARVRRRHGARARLAHERCRTPQAGARSAQRARLRTSPRDRALAHHDHNLLESSTGNVLTTPDATVPSQCLGIRVALEARGQRGGRPVAQLDARMRANAPRTSDNSQVDGVCQAATPYTCHEYATDSIGGDEAGPLLSRRAGLLYGGKRAP